MTSLLNPREYRNGVYAPSNDLAGAVAQVSHYKQLVIEEFKTISRGQDLLGVNPKCIVIIGNVRREFEEDETKKRSFELFRNNLKDVEVVSFDEIYNKLKYNVQLLEQSETSA